jgi:hypothetical protein
VAQFRFIEGEGDRRSKVRVVTALRALDHWYNRLPFTMLERLHARERVAFPAEELARMADRLTDIAWGHFSAQRDAGRLLEHAERWYRTLPADLREELEYYGYEFPAAALEEARAALSRRD